MSVKNRDIRPMAKTHDPDEFHRDYDRCVESVASEVWWLVLDLYETRVSDGLAHHHGEGSDHRKEANRQAFLGDVLDTLSKGLEEDSFELAADRGTA